MIKDLRVDDRLIHGQIALKWPKALNVNRILVANDAASKDKTQQMTLKMAVSSGIKVLIKSVDDTLKLFENPKARDADMMIIVGNVSDAVRLVQGMGDVISRVNIANTGRFDGVPDSQKISIVTNVVLNSNEQEAFNYLINETDKDVVQQIVPDEKSKNLRNLTKN